MDKSEDGEFEGFERRGREERVCVEAKRRVVHIQW